jgi:hypothetical protein
MLFIIFKYKFISINKNIINYSKQFLLIKKELYYSNYKVQILNIYISILLEPKRFMLIQLKLEAYCTCRLNIKYVQ